MIIEAFGAALSIAVFSLTGALFFGNSKKLSGVQKYFIPAAVGVFLSLILFELLPETFAASPSYGGYIVFAGFLGFYALTHILHKYFHQTDAENCGRKSSAILLLIGDAVHNVADGILLGSAFLVNPALGFATAAGLALHEIPQEIVEFGVLVRAGYSKMEALLLNFISASSIFIGLIFVLLAAERFEDSIWVFSGIAAGGLLFLAASELLPRTHGSLKNYGNIAKTVLVILVGFVLMSSIITWSHETFDTDHGHEEALHVDEH